MTAPDATTAAAAGAPAGCGCGAVAAFRCEACGARLCEDHALGPRRPRPAHFRVVSFTDLLRDYPVQHGLDEVRFWAVRAALAEACPPGVRCAGCWEAALDAAVAATPAVGTDVATDAVTAAASGGATGGAVTGTGAVLVADLLAAWRRTGKPAVIRDETIGRSRFRSARGWRVGTLYEDRYARDGEGTVRVQTGPVYLLADGELWTRGRRLDPTGDCPVAWLPDRSPAVAPGPTSAGVDRVGAAPDGEPGDGNSGDGHEDPVAAARAARVSAARRRAEATLRQHGWL